MWQKEYYLEVVASSSRLWAFFRDVSGWKKWNAGIERIELRGPFATGTTFLMQPPGQEAFESTLIEVKEPEHFIDETCVGDVVVRVDHRLIALSAERTRVVYAVEVNGPGSEAIGQAISADFPDVLKALARLAEAGDYSAH